MSTDLRYNKSRGFFSQDNTLLLGHALTELFVLREKCVVEPVQPIDPILKDSTVMLFESKRKTVIAVYTGSNESWLKICWGLSKQEALLRYKAHEWFFVPKLEKYSVIFTYGMTQESEFEILKSLYEEFGFRLNNNNRGWVEAFLDSHSIRKCSSDRRWVVNKKVYSFLRELSKMNDAVWLLLTQASPNLDLPQLLGLTKIGGELL